MGTRHSPDDPLSAASEGMNMTPMIDIVFQLIVFLMVANDMSRKEIEDLDRVLPPESTTDEAFEDEPDELDEP